ncbi:membrane protein insertase YidC [Streptococcus suis]|uniref:membrane protein insertase YidC n=2 Tax=Streptococcus suis TaxID=1307 RepID=UPI000768B8A7|nr:membrane protein OxaA 1 [Streptococcus suis]
MKKKVKWAGLLVASLIVLTACGTGPVTSQSTDAWDRLIYWFASIIQFLSINGQIGIGIILFTILIRTLLLPLFQIQMNSSRKMQELQPQLKKLQAEYPGTDMESRQQLYEATQALYKENGVSMRASMIPLFIQMPILLALFQALTRVEALKVGHFLWLNLGEPDPFFILPIMAAVFTFLSSWLTNKSAIEKNMAMTIMTYVMPVMIFFFAVAAASGVAQFLNAEGKTIEQIALTPENLVEMIALIADGTISSKIAKKVFVHLAKEGGSAKAYVEKAGLVQISDPAVLIPIIHQVFADNEAAVADFKSGKRNADKAFTGFLMKATKGQANPQVAQQLLAQELAKLLD